MNKDFARKIAEDAKDAHSAELLRVPLPAKRDQEQAESKDDKDELVAYEGSANEEEPRAEQEIA